MGFFSGNKKINFEKKLLIELKNLKIKEQEIYDSFVKVAEIVEEELLERNTELTPSQLVQNHQYHELNLLLMTLLNDHSLSDFNRIERSLVDITEDDQPF